ncbi:MAG: YdcF family protein [Acidobacteriia bacterium]|nr:YdcF family protein [Terriglobia bacterium]
MSTAARIRFSRGSVWRWAVVVLLIVAAIAQQRPPEPAHAPVRLDSPVEDKNFYLFSMLERTPGGRAAVASDAVLARIAAARREALDNTAKSCNLDLDCYAGAFLWSDQQSAEAAHALAGLYRASSAVRDLTDGPLRSSGMYVRYNGLGGEEFLERAWSDCIRGVNHAIDVYGLGKAPRYPAIDSITYDVKSVAYRRVVQTLAAVMEDDRARLDLVFSPSLRFALELMLLNHRDEAGRYEPMEAGENRAAFQRMKSVVWSRYPYSVIVVPGSGNDRPGVRLSPAGALRDEVAAKRFRDGKAPFVLVSGGFVHPQLTEFAEAIEMKRDLITRFGIPAEAILIDPHARRTTTNLRNAARLMYRYGMPFDKKALVTTDLSQSQSIESAAFEKRCLDELGYVPYKLLGRTSPFDLEFLPTLDSLHADPQDPLDP